MTSYIKFDMDVQTWNEGGYDPEDEWSRDSHGGSVSAGRATLMNEDNYDCLGINADVKVGDTVYLVWAQYSTGDSFGRDGGQYELLDVFTTNEDAEARRKFYDEAEDDGTYGEKSRYLPWFGYFECLDGIYVDALVVR